jgi:2,3-bisphosphoglycerate-independent phosphoglycerate mutase
MKQVVLIVLDGFGIAPPGPGNAIYLANPVNINSFQATYPHTVLKASGEAVGLPANEVGNTEVGHINLGAGRIVHQDLPRINMAIADGSFYHNPAFLNCADHVKKNDSSLHLIGLISEGIVHSALDHLLALLYFAKENGIKKVYVHAITDGRDSPPKSAINILKMLEDKLSQLKTGEIASVMGRYYAMDRDSRWERTAKAYFCLTQGQGEKASTATEAVENAYKKNLTDEFILPTNILKNNQNITLIQPNDGIIFFNFRIDRARQLTKAFVLDDFENTANKNNFYDPYSTKYFKSHLHQPILVNPPFTRGPKIKNLFFVTMTEYEKNLPVTVAFPPIVVLNPLGEVLENNNLPQLHMAESEKERFVTFYFNGQREIPFRLEDRIIIPSPKVPTYDQKPEMSANELTEVLIEKIRENKYPFILINYANPDMVGHTGNIQATISAIKTLDYCLGKIVNAALANNTTILITADHGNAEQKINPQTGEISTEHTANLVPFIAISNKLQGKYTKLPQGILADVAPTVLALLGIPKPETMTGRNLLEEIN